MFKSLLELCDAVKGIFELIIEFGYKKSSYFIEFIFKFEGLKRSISNSLWWSHLLLSYINQLVFSAFIIKFQSFNYWINSQLRQILLFIKPVTFIIGKCICLFVFCIEILTFRVLFDESIVLSQRIVINKSNYDLILFIRLF